MSYLTQMLGLATHNFWSAAVGMAMAVAFIRGIARREATTLGNFWVDITRGIMWILLPLSMVLSIALVSQGVIQNFRPYTTAKLIDPQRVVGADGKATLVATQTIPQGPAASQEAIKMLGTNGGGFFNANSAHPFENPTPLTNFLEMLAIFVIPAGLTMTLGEIDGKSETWLGRPGSNGSSLVCRNIYLLLGRIATQSPNAWRGSAGVYDTGWRQHGG